MIRQTEKRLLEAGKIVNTHGVRGEVRIQPWADSPEFLMGFDHVYIDGEPRELLAARAHKGCVIASFAGVEGIDGAIRLKKKVVSIDREGVSLEEGRYFVADLIGLRAVDAETGETLGTVTDVLSLPANDVYVIKGAREILVPAVPDFIDQIDVGAGLIRFRMVEGL
jgi:16S rRNA processing protein RimM